MRSPAASFFGPPVAGEAALPVAELAAQGVDVASLGVFPALVDLITSFGQRQLGNSNNQQNIVTNENA